MSDVYPDYPEVVLAIVVIDCQDPQRLASFWGELLGRKIESTNDVWVNLEWAPRFGAGLSFQRVETPKSGKNRVHPDIICADPEATAVRVEALGGQRAVGYSGEGAIVMLDPEGNEFCLIRSPAG